MSAARRTLLAVPGALLVGLLWPARHARAARRRLEHLAFSVELPDHWVPIPGAEILEARERALAAGAPAEWTMQAAWQPPPHLRWFTLPHLALETRPAPGAAPSAPVIEHLAGRSGPRTVHTHRALWHAGQTEWRLSLLALEDRREEFEAWVASLSG